MNRIIVWIKSFALSALLAGSIDQVTAFSTTGSHGIATKTTNSRTIPSRRSTSPALNAGAATPSTSLFKIPHLFRATVVPPPPPPPNPAMVIQRQVGELAKHSAVLGRLKSILGKFVISPTKTKLILNSIAVAVQWEELFFFAFLGWCFVPLLGVPEQSIRNWLITTHKKKNVRPYHRSYTKLIADNVAGISRIGFIVYITDIIRILLQALGFTIPYVALAPKLVAKSLITWWCVNRVSAFKRYLLAMQTRNNPGDLVGSASLVDHLFDAFLYGIGAYLLIDSLQANFSTAQAGLAAVGGVSTLVVSLALQGLVSQLFYGLFLAASNKIRKGDVVQFGDGAISGTVASLGWTDTLVRGGDGVMASVPNKELADKPIRNLSRIQISSVKQNLLFKYSDADKIPDLLEAIKEEIKTACPALILDGSRPFRAFWTGYGRLGLEVEITAHFRIKLLGNPFHENRQNMLVAINKAVKGKKMSFAVVDEMLLRSM